MQEMETVVRALSRLRVPVLADEFELHDLIARALEAESMPYEREARLMPRCRVDFLCGTVAVEAKRGWPLRRAVLEQLRRYAASPKVEAIVLVSEHALLLPERIEGKPCVSVALGRLWGVAY